MNFWTASLGGYINGEKRVIEFSLEKGQFIHLGEFMEIRKAEINDANVVGEVHSTAWKQAYANVFPAEYLSEDTPAQRTREFQESCSDEKINYYLVYEGEKAVGIVKIISDKIDYEISSFYILQEYRNKGYGKKVIAYLKQLFDRAKIQLWVLEDNKKARQFYEKNGFRDTGKTRSIYRGKRYTQLQYEYAAERCI